MLRPRVRESWKLSATRHPPASSVTSSVPGSEPAALKFQLPSQKSKWRSCAETQAAGGPGQRAANEPVEVTVGGHFRDVTPADVVGAGTMANLMQSGDGRSFAYDFERRLSELYLVPGLPR